MRINLIELQERWKYGAVHHGQRALPLFLQPCKKSGRVAQKDLNLKTDTCNQ